MSDSQDGTPTGDPAEGGSATSQIHTINISCGGCGEAYSVSDDDGLAGMSFPCDNCGTMVEVPEMPWEDQGGTTFETTAAPAEMDFDSIPEEKSFDGGTAINVTCFSCLEEYNVSADDGLAGMDFPCDNCGADVKVPDHPWPDAEPEQDYDDDFFNVGTPLSEEELAAREEQGKQMSEDDLDEVPEESDSPAIEGGTKITVMCFSCLEEYNVSADDGLAGIEFPCSNCGADVQVPDHPWPDDEPEEDYDEDFFNVGTPLTEDELAARDEAKKQDDSESEEADVAPKPETLTPRDEPEVAPKPEKQKPSKKEAKAKAKAKAEKEEAKAAKAKAEAEAKTKAAQEEVETKAEPSEAPRPEPSAPPPREPSAPRPPMSAAPSGGAPKRPAGSGAKSAPRRPSVVAGGGRKLQARTHDPGATVEVVHEQSGEPSGSVDTAPSAVSPPARPASRVPEAAPAAPAPRKTFREPDRPRLDMRSGGISAPSGNYAGGGGGGDVEPQEVTVKLSRGGPGAAGPDPDEQPTTAFQRDVHSANPKRPASNPAKPKGPIVVRVVSPFFSGMKKLFSKGGGDKSAAVPIEQISPVSQAGAGGSATGAQEQARRRQVQIIHEQRDDIRRGVGVRDRGGDEELDDADLPPEIDPDEEARLRKIKNIRLAVLLTLLVAPMVIWRDVLFGPLLGDQARPESDKKFWENRESGQEEESNQPTVDLSEMLGAKDEEKANEVKKISADNVDSLSYGNLRAQVDELVSAGSQANKSLLLWARFRLAYAYNDPVARKQLISTAPKRLNSEEYGPMGLAAAAGSLVLQGKGNKARKLINRLAVTEGRESPQMLLVLALSQKPRGGTDKTVALLDDALAKNPGMIDARLFRASLVSKGTKDHSEWSAELVEELAKSSDPDSVVRASELLMARGLYDKQAELLEPYKAVASLEAVSPGRRDAFVNLVAGGHLHRADFKQAYEAAKSGLTGKSPSSAIIASANLAEAAGENPVPLLSKNSGMLGGGEDQGRVVLERLRWLIKQGKLKSATDTYSKLRSRPGIRGTPWMHMMDAELALAKGKAKQAKKSMKRATKGRSKNPYALYAREMLNPSKPGLGRLEQLNRKFKTPDLQLDLARAQTASGKLDQAESAIESLLWNQPGVTDPIETVLAWIDLVDRRGNADKARTLAETLQANRPNDLRPVNQLMSLAERNDDEDGAATWAMAKIRIKKKEREARQQKAAEADGTDSGTEAQRTEPGGQGDGPTAAPSGEGDSAGANQ